MSVSSYVWRQEVGHHSRPSRALEHRELQAKAEASVRRHFVDGKHRLSRESGFQHGPLLQLLQPLQRRRRSRFSRGRPEVEVP